MNEGKPRYHMILCHVDVDVDVDEDEDEEDDLHMFHVISFWMLITRPIP